MQWNLLLARGADKEIKDDKGQTAEDYAMDHSHYKIAQMVRNYNAMKEAAKDHVVRPCLCEEVVQSTEEV